MTPEELIFQIYQFTFWGVRAIGYLCGLVLFQICAAAAHRNHLSGLLLVVVLTGSAQAQTATVDFEACLTGTFTTPTCLEGLGFTVYSHSAYDSASGTTKRNLVAIAADTLNAQNRCLGFGSSATYVEFQNVPAGTLTFRTRRPNSYANSLAITVNGSTVLTVSPPHSTTWQQSTVNISGLSNVRFVPTVGSYSGTPYVDDITFTPAAPPETFTLTASASPVEAGSFTSVEVIAASSNWTGGPLQVNAFCNATPLITFPGLFPQVTVNGPVSPFRIDVDPSLAPGLYGVFVQAEGNGQSAQVMISLEVTAATSFTLSAPTTFNLIANQWNDFEVSVAAVNGFNGLVTLSIDPVSGYEFQALSGWDVSPGGVATLSIKPPAAVTETRVFTVRGASGAKSASTTTTGDIEPLNCTPCELNPCADGCDADGDGILNVSDICQLWWDVEGTACFPGGGRCAGGLPRQPAWELSPPCELYGDFDGDGQLNMCDSNLFDPQVGYGGQATRPIARVNDCYEDPFEAECFPDEPCAQETDYDGDGLMNCEDDKPFDTDNDGISDQDDIDSYTLSMGVLTLVHPCLGNYSLGSLCERAAYRDQDGDGVDNSSDPYPCGENGPPTPQAAGGRIDPGWRSCINTINANSNCTGCPDAVDIEELDLCGTLPNDWTGHPFAECDYDGDGCKNRIDPEPCDPEVKCACRIEIVPRFKRLFEELAIYVTGSTPEEIEALDLEEPAPNAEECERCPPQFNYDGLGFDVHYDGLAEFGNETGHNVGNNQGADVGFKIDFELAQNVEQWIGGEEYAFLRTVFSQVVTFFRFVLVAFSSYVLGRNIIAEIGKL